MAHAPAKCSFAGIANITCGSSRGKDSCFLLNKCVVQVKNHIRSCNLSRTKVTEYDLILATAGKFNRSHEQVEKMVVCLAHSSRYNYTGGHEGKRIALHCKNQLTGKSSI